MAFLIFGLFWMVFDHAPWWVITLFTVFQIAESIPVHTQEELTRWELRRILEVLERLEKRR